MQGHRVPSVDPASFGWQRGAAARIVRYSYAGHSFPQGVAAGTEGLWTRALGILCAQPGFRLPESTGLDAGMWGYADRVIAGTSTWSWHAYGLAVDIAAPWNPQGQRGRGASPHSLPGDTGRLLSPLRIVWGGDWIGQPDRMHLEIHATPAQVAALAGGHEPPATGTPYPLPAGYYYGPRSGPVRCISGQLPSDAPYRPGLARAQGVLRVDTDGRWGPVTDQSCRTWQAAHGLTADGLIGPITWASLGC